MPHLRGVGHNGPLPAVAEPPDSAAQYGRQLVAVSSAGVADGPQSVGGVGADLEVTVFHDSPFLCCCGRTHAPTSRERGEFAREWEWGVLNFRKRRQSVRATHVRHKIPMPWGKLCGEHWGLALTRARRYVSSENTDAAQKQTSARTSRMQRNGRINAEYRYRMKR